MAPPTSAVDRTFIIGISGSPHSGKTTLATNLVRDLGVAYNVDVYLLSQTDYMCDVEKGPIPNPFLFSPTNNDERNWKNGFDPACVKSDFWKIVKEMVEKGKGYDKAKLVKSGFKGAIKLHFDRIVVVEGPLLFHDGTPLKGMFDLKLFLDVGTPDKAFVRRVGMPDYKKAQPPWKYWMFRPYFDKIMWPAYKRLHRSFLSGNTQGVDVENQGRNASQTSIWAKNLASKGIGEQKQMWGTG